MSFLPIPSQPRGGFSTVRIVHDGLTTLLLSLRLIMLFSPLRAFLLPAFLLILAVARGLMNAARLAAGGAWTGLAPLQIFGCDVSGKTLGIVALVLSAVQDRPAADVAAMDVTAALAPFDLKNQLSSNRTQGVPNMIALIRKTAARIAGQAS